MGICDCLKDPMILAEERVSKEIELRAAMDRISERKVKKLLLLGTGESGKSTLLKQIVDLYGPGLSTEMQQRFIITVRNNVLLAIQTLIRNTERLKIRHANLDTQISVGNRSHAEAIMSLAPDSILTPAIGDHIKHLWADKGIRVTFANRTKFQLTDNSDYFLDHIERICRSDYFPIKDDILRSRTRTTGIVKIDFQLDGNLFQMFDVGGQRCERKKWIHCFENITALLFVVDLNCYDQVMFEDNAINRMHESLSVFADVINSQWFVNTPIILFLNKSDLFEQKIKTVHISACFPQYFGAQEFGPCVQYIRQAFEHRNLTSNRIYTHISNATNTGSIRDILGNVLDIVIRSSIASVFGDISEAGASHNPTVARRLEHPTTLPTSNGPTDDEAGAVLTPHPEVDAPIESGIVITTK